MKSPSTFLFDLVNSLTKAQKRYIKVKAGSKEKDYTELMDALLRQQVYNEAQLYKDHKGANFLKHLAVNKQYLYELVLNSLAQFGQRSMEDKVYEKIIAANTLISKGLYQASYKEIRKGKKTAEKYELFELQLLILNVEKKLLALQQVKSKQYQSVQERFNQEIHIINQIRNTAEYWYLNQKLNEFQLRFQKAQTKEQQDFIDSILQSELLQSIDKATNLKSKIYFFQANATYQFMSGNTQQAYEFNKQFLNLLEYNPAFMNIYAERYLSTLNNMLIDSLIIGKYEILDEGLNRLIKTTKRKEFKSIKNIDSRVFRQRYLLLLNWCLSQNEIKKAMQWIPEIEEGLEEYGNKIERHHRITFYYLNAYLLFLNQKYDKALHWINYIINDSNENVVKEIFYFARDLNLLIHFELGNYTLLQSLLASTPKYLQVRRALYNTEQTLFNYLNKAIKLPSKAEKAKIANAFRNDIQHHFNDPKEKRVFNYLDLRLWEIN